jgi:hypothetical protein
VKTRRTWALNTGRQRPVPRRVALSDPHIGALGGGLVDVGGGGADLPLYAIAVAIGAFLPVVWASSAS